MIATFLFWPKCVTASTSSAAWPERNSITQAKWQRTATAAMYHWPRRTCRSHRRIRYRRVRWILKTYAPCGSGIGMQPCGPKKQVSIWSMSMRAISFRRSHIFCLPTETTVRIPMAVHWKTGRACCAKSLRIPRMPLAIPALSPCGLPSMNCWGRWALAAQVRGAI